MGMSEGKYPTKLLQIGSQQLAWDEGAVIGMFIQEVKAAPDHVIVLLCSAAYVAVLKGLTPKKIRG